MKFARISYSHLSRSGGLNHSDGRLFFSFQSNGFMDPLGAQYQYHITDHLGNIMVQFEDRNYDGVLGEDDGLPTSDILVRNHYYSFGMLQENTWLGTAPGGRAQLRFKYNGKELHKGSRLLDYGFRYFDPGIGRFTGVDPLVDQMPAYSPYTYTFNNPISFIDPDGRYPYPPGAYSALNNWAINKWNNYRSTASGMKNAVNTVTGQQPSFWQSAGIEVTAATLHFGNFTSQNDVSVLQNGQHMDGSQATTTDKVLAGVFIALPISGGAVKNTANALIEGTIKVFRNGDIITETAYKFGNLGHPGTKPYREALEAVQGGGNFVAGSKDEALKMLDGAFPGIPNQTGKGQGKFGYRIDDGMSGSGLKNGHDGLHINYYNKDNGVKGTILIDK